MDEFAIFPQHLVLNSEKAQTSSYTLMGVVVC